MSIEANKAVVRRYFDEVIDGRADVLDQLFTADCIVHRLELSEPIRGLDQLARFLQVARMSIRETCTEVRRLVAEADIVCAHVAHQVVFAGMLGTPLGARDVAGQTASWSAMAMFRLAGGKIAEEWVYRDEIGILRRLGLLERR
jgi:steroid delta-isomerase-like uncharacterized protein